jgi:Cellulose biosynthesis protein BcsS
MRYALLLTVLAFGIAAQDIAPARANPWLEAEPELTAAEPDAAALPTMDSSGEDMIKRDFGTGWTSAVFDHLMPWWANPTPAREEHLLLFGSFDSGKRQIFSGAGLKYAPFGSLDESGFRILAKGGAAQWRAPGAKAADAEQKGEGSMMAGGDLMTGRGAVGVYLGPEMALKWASRKTVGTPLAQPGLRLQAELWDHPRPDMLVQLSGAVSTAASQIWSRGALGYQVLAPVFAGPEAEITTAPGYTKWRIGAHATGISVLGFNARLSAGREIATDKQRGLYATLSVHWRQ